MSPEDGSGGRGALWPTKQEDHAAQEREGLQALSGARNRAFLRICTGSANEYFVCCRRDFSYRAGSFVANQQMLCRQLQKLALSAATEACFVGSYRRMFHSSPTRPRARGRGEPRRAWGRARVRFLPRERDGAFLRISAESAKQCFVRRRRDVSYCAGGVIQGQQMPSRPPEKSASLAADETKGRAAQSRQGARAIQRAAPKPAAPHGRARRAARPRSGSRPRSRPWSRPGSRSGSRRAARPRTPTQTHLSKHLFRHRAASDCYLFVVPRTRPEPRARHMPMALPASKGNEPPLPPTHTPRPFNPPRLQSGGC